MPPRRGTGNRVPAAAEVNPPVGVPLANVAAGLVEPVVVENFGRDKGLKGLSQKSSTQGLHRRRLKCTQCVGRMDYVDGLTTLL